MKKYELFVTGEGFGNRFIGELNLENPKINDVVQYDEYYRIVEINDDRFITLDKNLLHAVK